MQEHSDPANQFRLTVYIEDQVSQKGPFQIVVHKPWRLKLSQLKQRAQALWNIPASLQHWILNGSVPENDQLALSELCSGSAAIGFLCIVASQPEGASTRRHSTTESGASGATSSGRTLRQKKVSRSSTCALPKTLTAGSTQQRQLTINELAIKINEALIEVNALKSPKLLANDVSKDVLSERRTAGPTAAPLALFKDVTNSEASDRAEVADELWKPGRETVLAGNSELERFIEDNVEQPVKADGGIDAGLRVDGNVEPELKTPVESSIIQEKKQIPPQMPFVENVADTHPNLIEKEDVESPGHEETPEPEVLTLSAGQSVTKAIELVKPETPEREVDTNLQVSTIEAKCHSEQVPRFPSLVPPPEVPAGPEMVDHKEGVDRTEADRLEDVAVQVENLMSDVEGLIEVQEEIPIDVPLDLGESADIQEKPEVAHETEEKLLPPEKTANDLRITVSREQLYRNLMEMADNAGAIRNQEAFECKICFLNTEVGQGIVLRNCLHTFCGNCIENLISFSVEAQIHCPYIDENYSCDSYIEEKEIRDVVPKELFEKYLGRSIKLAELTSADAFHCKTPDCKGWCIIEGNVRIFTCPVCSTENCISCKAIHAEESCQEYISRQEKEFAEKNLQEAASVKFLKDMIKRGEALDCPNCHVVLLRKWGCDWLRCSYCKTEICWVTKGFRWGPNGKGDTSGGCRCGVNGVKCHPKCTYCH